MIVSLNEVKMADGKAYNRLLRLLGNVYTWKHFDDEQLCSVYVDNDCDLIAFESMTYRLQFVNNAHKVSDAIHTDKHVEPVKFRDFRNHMLNLGMST